MKINGKYGFLSLRIRTFHKTPCFNLKIPLFHARKTFFGQSILVRRSSRVSVRKNGRPLAVCVKQRTNWKQRHKTKEKGREGSKARVGPHTRAFSPSPPIPPPLHSTEARPTVKRVVVWLWGVCFSTARWAKQAHVTGLVDDALRELCAVPCFYRVSL